MFPIATMVREHLSHNIVPAQPSALVPVALDAVKLVRNGRGTEVVQLPGGVGEHGLVTAAVLVDTLRLEWAVFYDELDDAHADHVAELADEVMRRV